MSLAVACALIIGGVCLRNAQDVRVTDTSLTSRAEIHAADYDAKIVHGSDVLSPPDWIRMETACADGACVHYHKWCRDDGAFCRYHFSQPGEMQNIVIELTAHDHAALLRSEGEVGVMAANGLRMTEVPLTRFSITSPSQDPR